MGRRSRLGRPVAGLALLATLGTTLPAEAVITPFGRRVNESVELVVQYLRDQGIDEGAMRWASGLGMLCMLEKRASADWNAPPVGYAGMDPEDQERMRRTAAYMLELDPALLDQGTAYSYGTGSNLMALALYLATGGPADVGGPIDLYDAVRNGMLGLVATQGTEDNGCNDGGWSYYQPQNDGDLSCTQFALAGVSATSSVLLPERDLVLESLENVRPFVTNAKHPSGGHTYRGCSNGLRHSMAASGIWSYRISGLPSHEENVQSALTWWRDNYAYEPGGVTGFYYYSLWAAAKGFIVSRDEGMLPRGEGVYGNDIGGLRAPAGDGYPEEDPGWYFDFAWQLTETQAADGSWGGTDQRGFADTAWACLVLEKSLGGVCLDQDEDGLCETEDNCPRTFNPEQLDVDDDGLGDACDNCRTDPNLGQEDMDLDGIGDACDKLTCEPTPDGVELCNGRDDDCDGIIDNGDFERPGDADCRTDLPGVCARGGWECIGGEMTCIALARDDRVEICDLQDNDCDGELDEGVLNACGGCGGLEGEVCNNVDDDCNGLVDDGAACPIPEDAEEGSAPPICYLGQCALPCAAGGLCPDGLTCKESFCVGPCAGVVCEQGWQCAPNTGECFDPCAEVQCEDGLVCVDGRCGTCFDVGCPPGRSCSAVGGGTCVESPCADVECAEDSHCLNGRCVKTCEKKTCALGEECLESDVGAECVATPCGGVQCPVGQACLVVEEIVVADDGSETTVAIGACLPDVCGLSAEEGGVVCDDGQFCFQGRCFDDTCHQADCGDNARCEMVCVNVDASPEVVNCSPRCTADWLPPPPEAPDEEFGRPAEPEPVTEVAESKPTEDEPAGPAEADDDLPGGEAEDGLDEEGTGGEGCACAVRPKAHRNIAFRLAARLRR